MRAQISLPALGFALLVLTGVMVFGVAVADGALLSADRTPLERQAAVDLSDRLVSSDASLTNRANVLNATAVESLNGQRLQTRYGLTSGADASVSLDGETLVATGDTTGGTTISRLVTVEERTQRTITPAFTGQNSITLPRRSTTAMLDIRPRDDITVSVVRANDRVVLSNTSGLKGTFNVSLSPYRTTRFDFEANGSLSAGSVEITYYPTTGERARLEVTVDG